jgi:fatty-acid desaturase
MEDIMSIHARHLLAPLHLLYFFIAYQFITGHQQWSLYDSALILGWWTFTAGLGVAVGLHRYFCHHSFKAHRWADRLMLVAGALAGQGSPVFWVALHMGYHHPHSDKEKDIHSPVHGLWNSYMGWMIRLKADDVSMRYAIRMLRDDFAMKIHRHYNRLFWLSYAWIGMAALYFGGWPAVFAIATALLITVHQECAVNVLNHTRATGYQTYATGDNSVNNPVTGLLCWGQGWHNNHHEFPGRANFGVRWFEYDPTRLLIPLVRAKQ